MYEAQEMSVNEMNELNGGSWESACAVFEETVGAILALAGIGSSETGVGAGLIIAGGGLMADGRLRLEAIDKNSRIIPIG